MTARLAILLCLALAAPAQAQTGMVWQAYHGGASPGRAGVALFYGVPRSGDLLISGSCVISGPEPLVFLTLYTGDIPYPAGASVSLDITSPGRISSPIEAFNHGYDDFMGLTRLEAALSVQDPIWQIFAAPAPVAYNVWGGTPIALRGDPLPVQDFLATCAARGGPRCDSTSASIETGENLRLSVTNSSRGARRIVWLGLDGAPTQIGRLEPGQTGQLDTDAGHIWMFTDDQGRCVELRQSGFSRSGIELFEPGPD